MRRWGILGLGLALGLNIVAAWAGSRPAHAPAKLYAPARVVLPRPDPPGHWRYMTQKSATTTSKCVGQVTNPMCAVETYEACFIRGDQDLCRTALGRHEFTKRFGSFLWFGSSFSPTGWAKYRVLWAGRKPAGHLTPRQQAFYRYWHRYRDLKHPWPARDVKIVIQQVYCDEDSCLARPCWPSPSDFLLQATHEGWHVRAAYGGINPEGISPAKCW